MRSSVLRFLAISSVLAVASTGTQAVSTAAEVDTPSFGECRIGFGGHFKVGFWTPLSVNVSGNNGERRLRVRATTIDSDGVDISTTLTLDGGDFENGAQPAVLYIKVGQIGAAVRLSLLAEDNSVLDRLELSSATTSTEEGSFQPMLATSELVVHLGRSAIGLDEAFQRAGDMPHERALVRLLEVGALPTDWFGYESVNVLVLTTADVQLLRELAADERRMAALRRWLELGGNVIVTGSGDSARELLSPGGSLAELAPGRLTEIVRLPETGPLEHFATSETAPGAGADRSTIMVPQFVDVAGRIDVYAGRQPGDLPLVVRTARGFGQTTFAGVDLAAPPLDEWPGRKPFLQAILRPYTAALDEREAAQTLVARGYNDLSGALRQQMGRSFAGIVPITFSLVTVLAVGYLLLLGPVDYLAVHRWLRRPWIAWITLPLLVLTFGIGAMALSDWRRAGVGVRINQMELVDIDTRTDQARGTFWAALFSPRAEQFSVALDVHMLGSSAPTNADVLLSWWGLPGVGIGGMHSSGNLDLIRDGYAFGQELNSLTNMPVLDSATKSLLARWTARAPRIIDAQLRDEEGLIEGSIENVADAPLRNCRLLYNGWAYRLGNLAPGRRIDLGDEISPRRVKTVVAQDAAGPAAAGQEEGSTFAASQATALQIVSLMAFYEAAGGFAFAQLGNDYQSYCDFSPLLELGRAVLVAEVPAPGSTVVEVDSTTALGTTEDSGVVVYRFVLPVPSE